MTCPRYWVCQTRVERHRGSMVTAQLQTRAPLPRSRRDCGFGFKGPDQAEPYGVPLELTYRVPRNAPHPDNYPDSFGFSLYSERLVEVMQEHGVACEVFPVTLVDGKGQSLPALRYAVFHLLGQPVDAMDAAASGWAGSTLTGVPRLVLAQDGFKPRPFFLLRHLYVKLMADELRRDLEQRGITGFAFLDPLRYRSGSFGPPPEFDD